MCGSLLYVLHASLLLLYGLRLLPAATTGDCAASYLPTRPADAVLQTQHCAAEHHASSSSRLVWLELCIPVVLWVMAALGYGSLVAASNQENKMGKRRPMGGVREGGEGKAGGQAGEAGASPGGGVGQGREEEEESDETDDDDDDEGEDPYSEELQEKEQKVSPGRPGQRWGGHAALAPHACAAAAVVVAVVHRSSPDTGMPPAWVDVDGGTV